MIKIKKFSYVDIAHAPGPHVECLGRMGGYCLDHSVKKDNMIQRIHIKVFTIVHDNFSLYNAIEDGYLMGKGEFSVDDLIDLSARTFIFSLHPFKFQLPRDQKTKRIRLYDFTLHIPEYSAFGSIDMYSRGRPDIIWGESYGTKILKESINNGITNVRKKHSDYPIPDLKILFDPIEEPLKKIYWNLKGRVNLEEEI